MINVVKTSELHVRVEGGIRNLRRQWRAENFRLMAYKHGGKLQNFSIDHRLNSRRRYMA